MNAVPGGSDPLVTIGEFGRLARLSARALRLYEARGLLVPAVVDPRSGYRFYRLDQLDRARRIALLREAGMPLAEITHLVDLGGEESTEAVQRWWRGVETRHRVRRALLPYLLTALSGRRPTMYDVHTREVAEQKVLTVQRRLTVTEIDAFLRGALTRLRQHLSDSGATVSGAELAIFHGPIDDHSDGPLEVCVPFTGPVEPAGELVVRLEPAHQEAYVTVPRKSFDYPQVLEAYDAVGAWLVDRHAVCTASCREVYLRDPATAGPDDPVADVAFPYRPA
jgi:DNA-binding transcriptional MerR regulator